jgi:hypothetical protein
MAPPAAFTWQSVYRFAAISYSRCATSYAFFRASYSPRFAFAFLERSALLLVGRTRRRRLQPANESIESRRVDLQHPFVECQLVILARPARRLDPRRLGDGVAHLLLQAVELGLGRRHRHEQREGKSSEHRRSHGLDALE